jgi:PKD repeat protein
MVAQDLRTDKLAVKLQEKLAAEPEAYHSVNILLTEQADLRTLDAALRARRAGMEERVPSVIHVLRQQAASTQGELIEHLRTSPDVLEGSIQSFWIANAVFASVRREGIAKLSQRSDIAWIGLNGPLARERQDRTPPPPVVPNGREPGLGVIKAPAMWAMGYTGYGRVAFTNDTGIDPTHPALETRYRGLYVPPSQTWFQYNPMTMGQADSYVPFDCGEHGTHVTGTILGLDRLAHDTTGVAFNAQWIGSAILCGIGTADNVAAFQWSLDPDGDPGTISDLPDIINNSWYDPQLSEADCFSVYALIEEAMEAAGIAVIFSAGNAGPDPMTITPPHNINLSEVSAFTVGALDGNNPSLNIANFSSRGPSQCGGDSSILIKPEVSAPGVSVRSCVPGNQYDFFSGTSMAAPHVSGAILLLKEAFPYLTGKELKTALYHTCTDLGVPGEDNTYGMGVIDVLAAFEYLVALGHEPVSPYVVNDILLVDMQLSPFSCEEEVLPLIIVENGGTDTLHSFTVSYDAGAGGQTWEWSGTLSPRQREQINLPAIVSTAGLRTLRVELSAPNGVADEKPLNNRLRREIFVTQRERFPVAVNSPDPVCAGGSALLRGIFEQPGAVSVDWYDAPLGGNLVGSGQLFETPILTEPSTFYAEATYTLPLGPADNTIGETASEDEQDQGLTLRVYADIRLKSVKVFTENTGARAIILKTPDNETVFQKIAFLNQTGEVKVNLNWDIPAGEYELVKALGKPLYHNTAGASYPYQIEGVLSVDGTVSGETEAWYYFYDWEVMFREPCDRTPVQVDVLEGSVPPSITMAADPDSVDLTNGGSVQFSGTSADIITGWSWDFGDGNSSTEAQPVHSYTQPGTYVISLTGTSGDGCSAYVLDTVQVTASDISHVFTAAGVADRFLAVPNPVSGQLTVYLDTSSPTPVEIRVLDLTGRTVKVDTTTARPGGSQAVIDMRDLPGGLYVLTVRMGSDSLYSQRLIKL